MEMDEGDLENAVRRTESVGFYEQACDEAPGERSRRIWGLALAVHVCAWYHVLYPQNSAQPVLLACAKHWDWSLDMCDRGRRKLERSLQKESHWSCSQIFKQVIESLT